MSILHQNSLVATEDGLICADQCIKGQRVKTNLGYFPILHTSTFVSDSTLLQLDSGIQKIIPSNNFDSTQGVKSLDVGSEIEFCLEASNTFNSVELQNLYNSLNAITINHEAMFRLLSYISLADNWNDAKLLKFDNTAAAKDFNTYSKILTSQEGFFYKKDGIVYLDTPSLESLQYYEILLGIDIFQGDLLALDLKFSSFGFPIVGPILSESSLKKDSVHFKIPKKFRVLMQKILIDYGICCKLNSNGIVVPLEFLPKLMGYYGLVGKDFVMKHDLDLLPKEYYSTVVATQKYETTTFLKFNFEVDATVSSDGYFVMV